MTNDLLFLFGNSPKVYIVADIQKKRIIFFNKTAKNLYNIHEKTYSLEDIFVSCEKNLHEMIMDFVTHHNNGEETLNFPNLQTTKPDGCTQMADLLIGYLTPEKSLLFLELNTKVDDRERVLKDMVDNTSKAMFLANLDDDYSIFYANDLFYQIFGKDQQAFEHFYKNSFMATMVAVNNETFARDVKYYLLDHPDYHADIQVATVQGVKKWFYLDLQYRAVSHGSRVLKGMLLPIADRVEVQKQLEHINGYFEAFQELTTGALFYINRKTKTGTHHSKLLRKAGFPERMDNFPHCALPMLHPDDASTFLEYADAIMKGVTPPYKIRYRRGTDVYSWARLSSYPIFDQNNEVIEVVGRIENIDSEIQLLERATIDPLTNALNKEFAKERIETILHNSSSDLSHAFFFMDLDNFKYVNDNLGHKFGDYLLSELGHRMQENFRSDDIIGRVGGDEFVFLVRNISNFEVLLRKASNLLDTIGKEFDDGTHKHTIFGSIGIAVYPSHGTTYEQLYHRADLALYRSKHRGKNMATIYQSTMEGHTPTTESHASTHDDTQNTTESP